MSTREAEREFSTIKDPRVRTIVMDQVTPIRRADDMSTIWTIYTAAHGQLKTVCGSDNQHDFHRADAVVISIMSERANELRRSLS